MLEEKPQEIMSDKVALLFGINDYPEAVTICVGASMTLKMLPKS